MKTSKLKIFVTVSALFLSCSSSLMADPAPRRSQSRAPRAAAPAAPQAVVPPDVVAQAGAQLSVAQAAVSRLVAQLENVSNSANPSVQPDYRLKSLEILAAVRRATAAYEDTLTNPNSGILAQLRPLVIRYNELVDSTQYGDELKSQLLNIQRTAIRGTATHLSARYHEAILRVLNAPGVDITSRYPGQIHAALGLGCYSQACITQSSVDEAMYLRTAAHDFIRPITLNLKMDFVVSVDPGPFDIGDRLINRLINFLEYPRCFNELPPQTSREEFSRRLQEEAIHGRKSSLVGCGDFTGWMVRDIQDNNISDTSREAAEASCEREGGLPTIKELALLMNPLGVRDTPTNGYITIANPQGGVEFYYNQQTFNANPQSRFFGHIHTQTLRVGTNNIYRDYSWSINSSNGSINSAGITSIGGVICRSSVNFIRSQQPQ